VLFGAPLTSGVMFAFNYLAARLSIGLKPGMLTRSLS
jgi:hypothetical protein